MRIFGIPLDSVTMTDPLQLKDKKLQGLSLEQQLKKLELEYVQDKEGKITVGIRPLYPWKVTMQLKDMDTKGKAKKFVAKRLERIVDEDYDTLKQMAEYYDVE